MKYAILILTAFLFSSCMYDLDRDKVTISRQEYEALLGDSTALKYPKNFTVEDREYQVHLGSDGHEYYTMYLGTGGYLGQDKDFHYPDCELCIKRLRHENNIQTDTLQTY